MVTENCKKIEPVVVKLCSKANIPLFLNTVQIHQGLIRNKCQKLEITMDIAHLCIACFGAQRWHVHSKRNWTTSTRFSSTSNTEIVTKILGITNTLAAHIAQTHYVSTMWYVTFVLCKSRNLREVAEHKLLSPPCHLCAATSCQVLDKTGHVTKVCVPVLH